MGLSSSQARLLNLTARMHQIEYKAAKLEAQKLQMANESRRVYDEYLEALDKTKVQIKTINSNGSFDYVDATYNSLIAAGYQIELLEPIVDDTTVPEGYTEISTYEQLASISSTGKYFLKNDITIPSGTIWNTISLFSGVIDGNGHVIKGLNNTFINESNGATLKNLGFTNVDIDGEGNVASIVILETAASVTSQNGVTIENCWIDGAMVENAQYAGGFIGYQDDFGGVISIKNCYTNDIVFSNIDHHYGDIIADTNGFSDFSNIYSTTSNEMIGMFYDYGGKTSINEYPTVRHVTSAELVDLKDSGVLPGGKNGGVPEKYRNSTEWLTNMIAAGAIILLKPDNKGNFYETSVAIDTGLQEVSDETLLRKAEAKYEADMRKIDMKDRKYDTDLAALDTERNAIKSEMETLKTVAKDNVERTFKLFS